LASSLQDQNKEIARRAFEEILSHGRFELAEQLYAKDFINHGIHSTANLEEDQAALKGWHQAFPDVVIVPEKLIAEGDLVTIYWVARGTNTGTGNGLPATGNRQKSGTGRDYDLANRRWQNQGGVVRIRSTLNDATTGTAPSQQVGNQATPPTIP